MREKKRSLMTKKSRNSYTCWSAMDRLTGLFPLTVSSPFFYLFIFSISITFMFYLYIYKKPFILLFLFFFLYKKNYIEKKSNEKTLTSSLEFHGWSNLTMKVMDEKLFHAVYKC